MPDKKHKENLYFPTVIVVMLGIATGVLVSIVANSGERISFFRYSPHVSNQSDAYIGLAVGLSALATALAVVGISLVGSAIGALLARPICNRVTKIEAGFRPYYAALLHASLVVAAGMTVNSILAANFDIRMPKLGRPIYDYIGLVAAAYMLYRTTRRYGAASQGRSAVAAGVSALVAYGGGWLLLMLWAY